MHLMVGLEGIERFDADRSRPFPQAIAQIDFTDLSASTPVAGLEYNFKEAKANTIPISSDMNNLYPSKRTAVSAHFIFSTDFNGKSLGSAIAATCTKACGHTSPTHSVRSASRALQETTALAPTAGRPSSTAGTALACPAPPPACSRSSRSRPRPPTPLPRQPTCVGPGCRPSFPPAPWSQPTGCKRRSTTASMDGCVPRPFPCCSPSSSSGNPPHPSPSRFLSTVPFERPAGAAGFPPRRRATEARDVGARAAAGRFARFRVCARACALALVCVCDV